MNRIFFLSTIIALVTIKTSAQQITWIDKNENEDYVKRHECSFVQSGDKFIMFGGRESATRLDIYDYKTDTWSQGAEAPIQFNHFQATEYSGLVWVIGSFQTNNYPNEVPASHIYMYNPALNYWIQGPEIPEDRRRGGAGLVIYNDKFYLVAGNTKGHNGGYIPWLDVYDPINNTWKRLKDAPHARDHFSAAIINNKIYAASGRLSGGEGGTFSPVISEVDVYDLATNTWKTLNTSENLPTPRAGTSVVNFKDELLVIGGEGPDSGPSHKTVEAYNPTFNKWIKKEAMHYSRHGTQAIVTGNGIHIAGGSPNRGGGRQHNMEVYGKDKPKGKAIKASILSAPKSISFSSKKNTKKVCLLSTKGNAGNFIKSIRIIGAGANQFSLSDTFVDRLLNVKGKLIFNITAKTTSNESENAVLTIVYDNKTLDIPLIMK